MWDEFVREVIRNSTLDRSGLLYAPAALFQGRDLYFLLKKRLDGSKN
jgi:hypothetical protein